MEGILVAIAGSDYSVTAVQAAIDLAQLQPVGEVRFVQVVFLQPGQLGKADDTFLGPWSRGSDKLETRRSKPIVTHAEMPVIFVGEYVLTDEQEAWDRLPECVKMYLDLGGVTLPEIPPTSTPEATTWSEEADKPPIHLAYFYQLGCQECDRIQLALNHLQDQYPRREVCSLDVREQAPLAQYLGEKAELPVGKRLTAPVVFVGDDALVGGELHTASPEALLAHYADTGAKRLCTRWEAAS